MVILTGKYSKMRGYYLTSLMLISIFVNLANSQIINCSLNDYSAGVPEDQPQTDVGSFMVYQSFQTIKNKEPIRDIFVYWKEIHEAKQCDTSFEYYVTCTPKTKDNATVNISSQRSYRNYVRFENLSTSIEYTFLIYASNRHGLSLKHSIINVPSEQDRSIIKNLYLTKILIDQNIVGLSWINDNQESLNHNYTIFLCEKNLNLPYECKGYISWLHVPGSASSYFHSVDDPTKSYNFAISENWELKDHVDQVTTRSSGMIFASCGIMLDNTLNRIDSIYIDYITSTSIEMHWTFECSDVVEFIGYDVEYCITVSKYNFKCQGSSTRKSIDIELQSEKISDHNITMFGDITALIIEGLQADTTYKFTIYAKSNMGTGIPTKPILVTTQKLGAVFKTSDSFYARLGEWFFIPRFSIYNFL